MHTASHWADSAFHAHAYALLAVPELRMPPRHAERTAKCISPEVVSAPLWKAVLSASRGKTVTEPSSSLAANLTLLSSSSPEARPAVRIPRPPAVHHGKSGGGTTGGSSHFQRSGSARSAFSLPRKTTNPSPQAEGRSQSKAPPIETYWDGALQMKRASLLRDSALQKYGVISELGNSLGPPRREPDGTVDLGHIGLGRHNFAQIAMNLASSSDSGAAPRLDSATYQVTGGLPLPRHSRRSLPATTQAALLLEEARAKAQRRQTGADLVRLQKRHADQRAMGKATVERRANGSLRVPREVHSATDSTLGEQGCEVKSASKNQRGALAGRTLGRGLGGRHVAAHGTATRPGRGIESDLLRRRASRLIALKKRRTQRAKHAAQRRQAKELEHRQRALASLAKHARRVRARELHDRQLAWARCLYMLSLAQHWEHALLAGRTAAVELVKRQRASRRIGRWLRSRFAALRSTRRARAHLLVYTSVTQWVRSRRDRKRRKAALIMQAFLHVVRRISPCTLLARRFTVYVGAVRRISTFWRNACSRVEAEVELMTLLWQREESQLLSRVAKGLARPEEEHRSGLMRKLLVLSPTSAAAMHGTVPAKIMHRYAVPCPVSLVKCIVRRDIMYRRREGVDMRRAHAANTSRLKPFLASRRRAMEIVQRLAWKGAAAQFAFDPAPLQAFMLPSPPRFQVLVTNPYMRKLIQLTRSPPTPSYETW